MFAHNIIIIPRQPYTMQHFKAQSPLKASFSPGLQLLELKEVHKIKGLYDSKVAFQQN